MLHMITWTTSEKFSLLLYSMLHFRDNFKQDTSLEIGEHLYYPIQDIFIVSADALSAAGHNDFIV
jgi:hypothetical protein